MLKKPILNEGHEWLGQSTYVLNGSLAELESRLPRFSRTRFTYENALNEYLDLIIREPEPGDERKVPVATVSKRYALIQHQEAVAWLSAGFNRQNWGSTTAATTARLSEYGERMQVTVALSVEPVEIREGDLINAEVVLWNSVDKCRSFEIAIRWLRLVCSNGLTIWDEDRLRKVHNVNWMSGVSPVNFLVDRLPRSRQRVEALKSWLDVEVDRARLIEWVDTAVTQQWGKMRAARVLHITQTGFDCAVGRTVAIRAASELAVSKGETVPGAPERANNVFDVYQALLWIAGREKSIEQQETLTNDALRLVSTLLPKELQQQSSAP